MISHQGLVRTFPNGGTTKTLFELAELQHMQGELEQARASYAKAAKQGHILPQYTYGEILRLGQGGTRRALK